MPAASHREKWSLWNNQGLHFFIRQSQDYTGAAQGFICAHRLAGALALGIRRVIARGP